MPPTEPPRSIHEDSAWFRFTRDLPPQLSRRSLTSSYTLFLPGGVLQDQGNVFSAVGEFVRDASLPYCNHLADYYKPAALRPRILRGKSLVGLCSGLQGLYYHWLLDVLPRIGMLRLQDLPSVHLYLRNDLSFQKQSLELLGIDPRQIVSAQDYPFATADEVIVPVHEVGPGQEVPAWTREFLRSAFLGRLTESGPPLPNRIYISRQGARWRRVDNEAEVMERLAKLGFVSVQLEQLRFAQQVALFQQAEAIVAPHGAGLANLIFSRPGTKVVEFQPHKVQDVFFNICRSLELDYYYLFSTTGPANPVNNQQQLHIDLKQLDQTLKLAEIA